LLLAAIVGGGVCLLFYRLDDRLLWGDEAETAVLARNVTRLGLPYTDDGRNVVRLYGSEIASSAHGVWTCLFLRIREVLSTRAERRSQLGAG
jgi:hypothetical protein